MRTQEEMVKRVKERKDEDMFGFETESILLCLDYDHAKEFLKPEAKKEEWDKDIEKADRDTILAKMKEYMNFAWDKANDCRGLSANRSIMHFLGWIWLAGDNDLLKKVSDEYENNYQHYGKEILKMICDHYKWDSSVWDDGLRTNGEGD